MIPHLHSRHHTHIRSTLSTLYQILLQQAALLRPELPPRENTVHFGPLCLSFANEHGTSPDAEVYLLEFGDMELGCCFLIDFFHLSLVFEHFGSFILEPLRLCPNLLLILHIKTQRQESLPRNPHIMDPLSPLICFRLPKLRIRLIQRLPLPLLINRVPTQPIKTLLQQLLPIQYRDFRALTHFLTLLIDLSELFLPCSKHCRE